MKRYLQHYFNPDFDYLCLSPGSGVKGPVDLYNLGYVQNVVKGQILAEIVPLDTVNNPIPRFICEDMVFPQGPNTYINPDHPNYLLSGVNGYVFYYDGKISVKKVLNIRSDVNFSTGNIVFVGDAVVHGDVKSGFHLQANNVLIKGMVEGGEVRSQNSIKVVGGARGGANTKCLLSSGKSMQVNFAEKVELRARNKLFIESFCMQSRVYAGDILIVYGGVSGGVIKVEKYIFVQGDVGHKAGVATKIVLGYDPFILREIERCEWRLESIEKKILSHINLSGSAILESDDKPPELKNALQKKEKLTIFLKFLLEFLKPGTARFSGCRFVVLGEVHPGVEVTIGEYSYVVTKTLENVCFKLEGEEVVVLPAPADSIKIFHNDR